MAVENIKSYNKYQGNGVSTQFSVNFRYNNKNDVVVYLKRKNSIQQEMLVVNVDYEWLNDTTIRFPKTGSPQTILDNGDVLAIYRETPIASDFNFSNQKRLFPEEVTKSDDLGIMLIQELHAMISRSLIIDETSDVTPLELVNELQSLINTATSAAATSVLAKDQAVAVLNDPNFIAVSGNLTTIGTVASNLTNINTVANDINNINSVSSNISNVNAVAGNVTDINSLATNMSDINSCASNISFIQDAPNQAQAAADSAELAAQYGNDKINQTHISNCITEIPQDIKLELNNGIIVIKAGSKVYIPDGFESDGTTPKFTTYTYETDRACNTPGNSDSFYLFPIIQNNSQRNSALSATFSGAEAPTLSSQYAVWYDTTNNKIKLTNDTGSTWLESQIAFPICIETSTVANSVSSIDQVFNGFGYIGLTVFALPGVKGLIPNGRNEDGTLKNIEFELNTVSTYNMTANKRNLPMYICSNNTIDYFTYGTYFEDVNKNIKTNNNTQILGFEIGKFSTDSNNRIISFTTKTVFHAVDYNDTEFIGHQAMPSDKYIDLTVLASGSNYTAPADGYFTIDKAGEQIRGAIIRNGIEIGLRGGQSSLGSYNQRFNLPVIKGDKLVLLYDSITPAGYFRFVYTEGSK